MIKALTLAAMLIAPAAYAEQNKLNCSALDDMVVGRSFDEIKAAFDEQYVELKPVPSVEALFAEAQEQNTLIIPLITALFDKLRENPCSLSADEVEISVKAMEYGYAKNLAVSFGYLMEADQ